MCIHKLELTACSDTFLLIFFFFFLLKSAINSTEGQSRYLLFKSFINISEWFRRSKAERNLLRRVMPISQQLRCRVEECQS